MLDDMSDISDGDIPDADDLGSPSASVEKEARGQEKPTVVEEQKEDNANAAAAAAAASATDN